MIGGGQAQPRQSLASPEMDAFRRRMEILNSLPPSVTTGQTVNLAYAMRPDLDKIIKTIPGEKGSGYWQPDNIRLVGKDLLTKSHELGHELQWQTGIGTVKEFGRGKGKYAKWGRVPRNIAEGAADVASGTRGYLPDLTVAERSQANSIAQMMLAAAREEVMKKGKK